MAQSDKVNVLPQEVTAKYSNPQTGINGAKREEVVLQKRGTPFLFKSPRRRQKGSDALIHLKFVLGPLYYVDDRDNRFHGRPSFVSISSVWTTRFQQSQSPLYYANMICTYRETWYA